MLSQDYQLADAIRAAVAAVLTDLTVELVGDPRADRKALTALRIRVRPASWEQTSETRAYDRDTREVFVAVVGEVDPTNLTALDAALYLCDRVRALWGRTGALRRLTLAGHEPLGERRQTPLYDEQSLLADKLFVGTLIVKYAICA